MKRAAQKHWVFEYYFGEYDEDLGYTGSTESTAEFTIKNVISVKEVQDLIADPSMSVELKAFIPHKVNGDILFDYMDILHTEIGWTTFNDGTKVPAKILSDWKKNNNGARNEQTTSKSTG